MHGAHRTFACAWRIFCAGTAVGDCDVMKGFNLRWRIAKETDGGTVSCAHGLSINRFADAERRAVMDIEEPGLARIVDVLHGLLRAQYAKNRIVKRFCFVDVI